MMDARQTALAFLGAAVEADIDGEPMVNRSECHLKWEHMKRYREGVRKALGPAKTCLPTPMQRDWRSGKRNDMGTNSRPLNEVVVHQYPGSGWLNPTFVEYLMGFPKDWTQP